MYPRIAINNFFSNNEINVSNKIKNIDEYERHFIPTIKYSNVMTNLVENNSVMGVNDEDDNDGDTSEKIGYYLLENEDYDSIQYSSLCDYILEPNTALERVIRMFDTYKSLLININKLQNNRMIHCDINKSNCFVYKKQGNVLLFNFSRTLIVENIKIGYLGEILDYKNDKMYYDALELFCLQELVPLINTNKFELDNSTRERLAKKFISRNPIFGMLTVEFTRDYYELIDDYLKTFNKLSKTELLNKLLNTCRYWDIHSISILYMEIINEMFDGDFIKNDIIILFVQLLLKNINPYMRMDVPLIIKELEHIHSIKDQYDNIMNLL